MNYLDELINAINEEDLTEERLKTLRDLINSKFPISLRKQEKEYDKICKYIIESIQTNNIEKAVNLLKLIYISDNYELGHTYIKSSGIFRSTKYDYSHDTLIKIINIVKDFLITININNLTNYYNSVINILEISPDIKIENDKIVSFLQDENNLRVLLNNSDHNFLARNENPEFFMFSNSIQQNIMKDTFYSPEEVSSSVSRILDIYIKSIRKNKIPKANFNSYHHECHINEILKSAFIINKYDEIEIDIGIFEYYSFFENKILKIQADYFEKQKRFGYFVSTQKRIKSAYDFILDKNNKDLTEFSSLKDIIRDLDFNGKIKVYSFTKNPDRFDLYPLVYLLKTEKYSSDSLFKEDILRLYHICHENYLSDDNYNLDLPIPEIKIHDKYSVLDYINLERIFKLANFSLLAAYQNNHEKIPNIDNVFSNSILRIYPKDYFLSLIKYTLSLNTDEEAEKILEPIVLDITEDVDHVDLQYTPILKLNENEYLSLTITSFTSDLIRRVCIKNKLSFSIDKTKNPNYDHMVAMLENNFKKRDFFVKTDFKFSKFELDLIALKDNTLFIFECKNPYHPTNNHELRNTYDHIEHAFFQLQRAKLELEDSAKLKQLFEQLGWLDYYNKEISIYYGICNANRMLVGYSKNDVYVHHAHQLINLLETGKVQNFDISESLWSGDDFHTADLVRFMRGQAISQNYDYLTEKYNFKFRTTNHEICIESYLSGVNQLRKQSNIEKNILVQLEDYI
ncbi:hypothetical protein [Acinetobacter bereziniae]|uniref:hypothetical protein n=1 Tax=Acinetobacter bereziniae TaxID=106648 RepID=UPI00300BCDB5